MSEPSSGRWIRGAGIRGAGISLALVATYYALEHTFRRFAVLPEAAYHDRVLTTHLAVPLLAVSALLASMGWFRRAALGPWSELRLGASLRLLATLAASVLTLDQLFAPTNPFFAQAYPVDRIVLLALGLSVAWRPAALLPFLFAAYALVAQKTHPIDAFIWAFDLLPLRVLTLCAGAWILETVLRRPASREGLVLVVALVASQYFYPGVVKLERSWLAHEHLENLLFGARTSGWLSSVPTETVLAWARIVDAVDGLLVPFVLALELGAMLVFFRRWSVLLLLVAWMGFHVGIFLLIGYCFWKWIVLEIALFWIFLRRRHEPTEPAERATEPLFTRARFVTVAVAVATAVWWSPPADLGWIDTRLAHAFRVEVATRSGASHELHPSAFGPYQDQMTMALFGYLSREPQLVGTYGVTQSPETAKWLHAARDLDEVERLIRENGQIRYREERARIFAEFLSTTLAHRNRSPLRGWQIPCFWSTRGESVRVNDPIDRASVWRVTTLFDGTSYREIARERVVEVDIPAAKPAEGSP